MTYEELKHALDSGGQYTLDFKEYINGDLDKRLVLELNGVQIIRYVKENEFLDRNELDLLSEHEGCNMRYTYCPYYYPYIRLVVKADTDVYIISINKLAVDTEMQIVNLNRAQDLTGGVKQWPSIAKRQY